MSTSDFYAQEHEVTTPILDAFAKVQTDLDQALERWTSLEDQVRAYRDSRQR